MSTYKKLDLDTYYRKGVYERFTKIARCSVSITCRIDITGLYEYSKRTGTKFYINFLYLLAKVMNSREDYRMATFGKATRSSSMTASTRASTSSTRPPRPARLCTLNIPMNIPLSMPLARGTLNIPRHILNIISIRWDILTGSTRHSFRGSHTIL